MKIKILIADDHRMFRNALRNIIDSQDDMMVIAEAENGVDAVKKVNRYRPSMILMDIKMPEMDGIDATRQISVIFPRIKIIALSSYADEAISKKMIGAGAWAYISKNCHQDHLLNCIRSVWKDTKPETSYQK